MGEHNAACSASLLYGGSLWTLCGDAVLVPEELRWVLAADGDKAVGSTKVWARPAQWHTSLKV
jgi:hypothetical protein